MSVINKLKRDKQTRKFFLKTEFNINLMKYNIVSKTLDYDSKCIIYQQFIDRFHLNSSSSRINNRCLFSGRSHWILRRFHMNRMTFKVFFDKGLLVGIKRNA